MRLLSFFVVVIVATAFVAVTYLPFRSFRGEAVTKNNAGARIEPISLKQEDTSSQDRRPQLRSSIQTKTDAEIRDGTDRKQIRHYHHHHRAVQTALVFPTVPPTSEPTPTPTAMDTEPTVSVTPTLIPSDEPSLVPSISPIPTSSRPTPDPTAAPFNPNDFFEISFQYPYLSTSYSVLCYVPTPCQSDPSICRLYIWTDGTTLNGRTAVDRDFLREMVGRGFVSCNPAYDDNLLGYAEGCFGNDGFQAKAAAIYDPTLSNSVTAQVCGTYANCDLGIASSGFSQGAHIASIAATYEPRVTASLMLGSGNEATACFIICVEISASCTNNDSSPLPRTKRRYVAGEDDEIFLRSIDQHKDMSGYDCGSNLDCFQPDGSGYYMVPNEGHEFFYNSGGFTSEFADPTTVWGAVESLDWLANASKLS